MGHAVPIEEQLPNNHGDLAGPVRTCLGACFFFFTSRIEIIMSHILKWKPRLEVELDDSLIKVIGRCESGIIMISLERELVSRVTN